MQSPGRTKCVFTVAQCTREPPASKLCVRSGSPPPVTTARRADIPLDHGSASPSSPRLALRRRAPRGLRGVIHRDIKLKPVRGGLDGESVAPAWGKDAHLGTQARSSHPLRRSAPRRREPAALRKRLGCELFRSRPGPQPQRLGFGRGSTSRRRPPGAHVLQVDLQKVPWRRPSRGRTSHGLHT